MQRSIDKAQYFLDSFITRKLLKLAFNNSNQFNYQYYLMFSLIISEIRRTRVELS